MAETGGPLLGRESETAALADVLASARAGASRGLVLRGEPGIGKTALLELAVSMADGFRVLRARGVESETGIAFAALHELFGPILDRVRDLPDRQRAVLEGVLALGPPVPGDPLAVCAATLGLLAAAAEDGPLLIAVDDAQWLDSPSAEALAFAVRRLENEGIAALFALRGEEPSAFDSAGLEELPVSRLGEPEARELLRQRSGAPITPGVVDELVVVAAGNPLALLELPATLSDAQRGGSEPLEHPLPVGEGIRRAFGRRLELLPADTQEALVVLAASEQAETRILTAALKARKLDERALDAAARMGLITTTERGTWFVHPLVRSVVYRSASADQRRSAHAALAAVSEHPGRRVWHQSAATPGPDESIAAELEAVAARAASAGAPATAARAFHRAAELSGDPGTSAKRLLAAAVAAATAGALESSASFAEQAGARTDDPITQARAQLVLARARGFVGAVRPAMEQLVSEAGLIESLDSALAAQMLMSASTFAEMDARLVDAFSLADRAHRLVAANGAATESEAAAVRCRAAVRIGGGQALADTLAELIPRLDLGGGAIRLASVAEALRWLERFEHAIEILRDVARQQRRAGSLSHLPYVLGTMSEAKAQVGDLAGAFADAHEGTQLAYETRQKPVLSFCLACCARIEAIRGQQAECVEHVAYSLEVAESAGAAATRLYAGAARGLLELGLGRPEDAITTLEVVARQAESAGLDEPSVIPWQPDLVEAYVQAGRVADAERELEVLRRRAESTGGTSSRAAVERCAGLLAGAGDFDTHFEHAASLLESRPMPFEQARTELCSGERQRRAGNRLEARLLLDRAYSTFSQLGAGPWAERARQELQATGITARPRSDPAPLGKLTPQELRVALIIAGGATVREAAAQLFLSPKTIEAHLGRAYRKLGVRNRAQLATTLGRQLDDEATPSPVRRSSEM